MRRYPLDEQAREHLRNALQLVRLTLETGAPVMGSDGPGFVVPVESLNAIQGRIEAALDRLNPPPRELWFPSNPED